MGRKKIGWEGRTHSSCLIGSPMEIGHLNGGGYFLPIRWFINKGGCFFNVELY